MLYVAKRRPFTNICIMNEGRGPCKDLKEGTQAYMALLVGGARRCLNLINPCVAVLKTILMLLNPQSWFITKGYRVESAKEKDTRCSLLVQPHGHCLVLVTMCNITCEVLPTKESDWLGCCNKKVIDWVAYKQQIS